MNIIKNKKNTILTMLCIVGIFMLIFIMSMYMVWNPDEYNYSNITWSNNRIGSISDIFESQKLLYLNWTGRVFVHFLIQLFLYINQYIFYVLNAIVFLTFILSIIKLVDLKINVYSVLGVFSLVWIFIPDFGETVIWLSGTLNYLWPTTILLFMLVIHKNICKYNYVLIFLVSLLAAITHENVAFIGGSYLFYSLIKNRENLKRKIISIIGFGIGAGILLFAPGNFKRAEGVSSVDINSLIKVVVLFIIYTTVFICINSKKIQEKISYFINKYIKSRMLIISILCLLGMITFAIIIIKMKGESSIFNKTHLYILVVYGLVLLKKIKDINHFKELVPSLNLLIIARVSLLPMILIGDIEGRSLFAVYSFIILSILLLVKTYSIKMNKCISILLAIISLPTVVITLNYYVNKLHKWDENFRDYIHESSIQGNNALVVEQQPIPNILISNKVGLEPTPITLESESITNRYVARYYGFNEMFALEKKNKLIRVSLLEGDKEFLELKANVNNKTINIDKAPESISLEPSLVSKYNKEVYFVLPRNANNIIIINKGDNIIKIAKIDKYSLDKTASICNEVELKGKTQLFLE